MRKIIVLLVTFVTLASWAQSEGFNYKFLITDNGNVVTNPVDVKISIKENGNLIWQEEHTGVQPDDNGIATVYVGEGTRTGGSATAFDDIDWSTSKTYDVEIDTGNGYNAMVADAPFKFVPKAKFAQSADFNTLQNKPVLFYVIGGTDYPTDIDQAVYRTGQVKIGSDGSSFSKLFVHEDEQSMAIHSQLDITDNNSKTGIYSELTGSGDGYQKAFGSYITAGGSYTQVNVWNENNSANSGTHLGTYNRLKGTGTGFQVGVMNEIFNANDNYQFAIYNSITNDGNGEHYGTINVLGGAGSAVHVGVFSQLNGSGSGDKYGEYILIPTTAGGTHYGLYVDVAQDSGYAAYFTGNVKVVKKLTSLFSGNADLKPFAYGSVLANGTTETTNSTDGFSVTHNGTGQYTVSLSPSPGSAGAYLVTATLENNTDFGLIRVVRNDDNFVVYTVNTTGQAADMNFTFVVYKK